MALPDEARLALMAVYGLQRAAAAWRPLQRRYAPKSLPNPSAAIILISSSN